GSNFPGKKPWEGGKKVWYDTAFILETSSANWKVAGHLPRPLGYGVSGPYKNGVICVGGSDQNRHYADAFRLEWMTGKLRIMPFPTVPLPIAHRRGDSGRQ